MKCIMQWKITVAVALLCMFRISVVQAQPQAIHLSVATSMTDAFKEITTKFSAEHPQLKLLSNFASSGALAKQIDQGAPVDIYVSANQQWMQYLVSKHRIAPKTARIFAYNKLVFIGEKKKNILSLADLPGLTRIALGSPRYVPAGQYARQAMEAAEIYATLQQQRKLVMTRDVRQALRYADRGEVDGAFVYRTDALLAQHAAILFTVPQNLYDRVSYSIAITVAGGPERSRSKYCIMPSMPPGPVPFSRGMVLNRPGDPACIRFLPTTFPQLNYHCW